LNGPTATNHCWTAVAARPDATATTRAVIGGFVGSINTCLKHAVDGYSFWGASILAKVGEDWAMTTFDATLSALAISELGAEANFNSQIGTLGGGGGAGMNLA